MTSPSRSSSTLPGYDLAAPAEADAMAALDRVFGAERSRALWSDACRTAGVVPGRVQPGAEIERTILRLALQGGAAATVARSLEIRLRTYARLAARQAAPSAGTRR